MLSSPSILVCTDFKQNSDYALKSAEVLRQNTGGKIHLIHISNITTQWTWMAEESSALYEMENLRKEIMESLEQEMSKQVKRCEADCTTHISLQPTYYGIMENIKYQSYDIVILGHKSEKSLGLFNLGSIAQKIASTSNTPVLVVKKTLPPNLEKIAALVDTEDDFTSILAGAEELSFVLSAELIVLSLWQNIHTSLEKIIPKRSKHQKYVFEDKEKSLILDWMRSKISKELGSEIKNNIIVEISETKRLAKHLITILDREHIELVVMKRNQKKFLEKILLGSETRRMLEVYSGNILILPPT